MSRLYVWKNDHVVGRLEHFEGSPSNYEFIYEGDAHAQDFVSLLMLPPPLGPSTYRRASLHPIFEMNLPEGERRQVFEQAARLGGADDMTLLHAIGRRQIGALRFTTSLNPADDRLQPLRIAKLSAVEDGRALFEEIFQELGASSGVSGVQPKTLAPISAGDPRTLIADTHILKRDRESYPGMVVSEAMCMAALTRCGLKTPAAELSGDGRLLAIERFDRAGGDVLHFEEFGALMGLSAGQKYDTSYERMAKVVKTFVQPKAQREDLTVFFKALVAHRILGNADAHAKNFGVLCHLPEDVRLAPIYDCLTTRAFIKTPPAVTLGGKAAWWAPRLLIEFAQRHCSLSGPDARGAIEQVCTGIDASQGLLRRAARRYPHAAEVTEHMRAVWKEGLADFSGHPSPRAKVKHRSKPRKKLRTMGENSGL